MTKFIQLLGALVGTGLGLILGLLILEVRGDAVSPANRPAFLMAMVAGALLFGYLVIPYVTVRPARWAVGRLPEASAGDYGLAVGAIVVGLLMGFLLGVPLSALPGPFGDVLPPLVSIVLALVMAWATLYKRDELLSALSALVPGRRRAAGRHRILVDTSAIIDGRIVDISKTGFIMGTLVIPRFVLDELQRIADSSDPLRRNRGRRGLEMLSTLQRESVSPVEIGADDDTAEPGDVDARLVARARADGASILTNDFNLNRVAEVQGIRVLNINQLANAVKSVLHPGEEMSVRIIQEGKEPGQGVGYLDDGTMIVVEQGSRYLDREIGVTVTRVLQTVAGRMIFAQPRPDRI
ncbi:MAG: PIN domain nuclease [Chloroflexota bacterium]|nr:PIN domain nuclease [Chloroflexota bacterium]